MPDTRAAPRWGSNVHAGATDVEILTIAFTLFLELDGSPNRMNYVVPSPEGDPPTGLEDGTTEK